MVLQHIAQRGQPQGTEQPLRDIVTLHAVFLQIVAIAAAPAATFHLDAKHLLYFVAMAVKRALLQRLALSVGRSLQPCGSYLLIRHAPAFELAYQPGEESHSLVHTL